MDKAKKMIVCRTCGAQYDASNIRCPYCGTAYAPAEEEAYMGKLEEIRADLEGYREDGNKSLKKGLGATVCVVFLVAAVIVFLIFGILRISGTREQSRADRYKEEFLYNQGITIQQENSENDL